MTDSKFFSSKGKGEVGELQEELVNPKEDKRKDAVKKVIAAMTVGKDVSALFTDVLNCIQTTNLELKKLVYLYVINYAKMQPERAILAVNTFQKDASDPNPLVRALAIRTMGCIRVDKVVEYLCEPLRHCLKDRDPYVRKTAALCVAKLYDMSPELVETQGFLDLLQGLLSDSYPSVVANAVAALSEIDEVSNKNIFKITSGNLNQLLNALNESAEWGQCFILNALSRYNPVDGREAESICERVAPRLNHSNSAVVLGAVKVLMMYMDLIQNQETVKGLCKKMAPPLVTLLTTKEPEIQYVALRNINLIVQKRPSILQHELRVFFIKYNDPIYVKMEKLEIMIMLAAERNIEQVLNEFKEAASEVDVEFVRKAVRAIGRCAIKIEKAAERCIQVLLELIQTKVNYVVQEAIIVIKDIFRKYPNRYESIIATLCENLDTLDEPEAKGAMIWIIGEYAERIVNADELLKSFLEGYQDENSQVQLQILTAVVKLFLKRPKDTQEMVQTVLNLATQETDNPDLRDRGYVYWRLLSTDPEAAKSVVLGEKPLITDSAIKLEESLLDDLISNISSLASVYHKPPEHFVTKLKDAKDKPKKSKKKADSESLLPREDDFDGSTSSIGSATTSTPNIFDMDMLGGALPSTGPSNPAPQQKSTGNILDDLDFLSTPVATAPVVTKELVLPADKGQGLQIHGAFVRRDGKPYLDLTFTNKTSGPMSGLAIKFNVNSFALSPAQPTIQVIMPNQSADSLLQLGTNPSMQSNTPVSNVIQIALKNNVGVFYFQMNLPLHVLFTEDGLLTKEDYLGQWRSIPDERFRDFMPLNPDSNAIQNKLQSHNIFYVARRNVGSQEFLYCSAKILDTAVLYELANPGAKLCTKTRKPELIPLLEQSVVDILTK